MELKRLLTRATALLLQGAYQGAESFIEQAMAEADKLKPELAELDTLRTRVTEMASEVERLQSVIDEANEGIVRYKFLRSVGGLTWTQTNISEKKKAVNEAYDALVDDEIKCCGFVSGTSPIPEQQSPAVAAHDIARYCGHYSLADMVSTHIHVWRKLLQDEIEINESETPFINHELNALADIEGAVKFDLEHPSPRITEQELRKIIYSFSDTCSQGDFRNWHESKGRALLNKLNGDQNGK